eukprot:Clim_evm40s236 gene=Clim_evmTU40s236
MSRETAQQQKEWLKSLLNQQIFVEITDGRVFEGTFVCTDKDCNLVLQDVSEAWLAREPTRIGQEPADGGAIDIPPPKIDHSRRTQTPPEWPPVYQGKIEGAYDPESPYACRIGMIIIPKQHIQKMWMRQ